MQLRLKYAPVPENAARFAGDIVVSAAQVSGVHLDYTPDSLAAVDAILDGFRAEGLAAGQVAETLFGFGCYVGEVLTRHAGGRWRATAADELAVVGWPMVVELAGQGWCNPIAKAFKRLENGPEDSLRYFYAVFAPGGAR
ncbi:MULTISPECIES: hypothetical protein [Micromonospora]|uniref:hypothetical protein n=1 Tax=Micromonospora TaxID=1873 RepID=UPI0004C0B572|nr:MULTISPECIES: hypothetical protein [Micromonospora]OHX04919.1 hypothetical protein BFV98_18985 [Micromonospora sp. WMMB235]